MKVMVVGGCGFIGSRLVRALWDRHEVVVVDNLSAIGSEPPPPGVEFYRTVPDPEDHVAVDVVVNAACLTQERCERERLEGFWSNVKLTNDLVYYSGAPRIVHLSSVSVHGNKETINESSHLDPCTVYGGQKAAAEMIVRSGPIPYTILRLTNVFGPGMRLDSPYCGVIGKIIKAALRSDPLYLSQNGERTYTYIDNVVSRIVDCIEKQPYERIHTVVTTPCLNYDVLTLVGVVRDLTKRTIPMLWGVPRASDKVLSRTVRSLINEPGGVSITGGLRKTIAYAEEYYATRK